MPKNFKQTEIKVKEISYVLLFDKDSLTRSKLTLDIHKREPKRRVYNASSTYGALNLLDIISKRRDSLGTTQEVCFIVDLNMDSLEGYIFLVSLQKCSFSCPVRVYVFNDETREETSFPTIQQYQIAGRLKKPLDLGAVEGILNDHSPKYFQKEKLIGSLLKNYKAI